MLRVQFCLSTNGCNCTLTDLAFPARKPNLSHTNEAFNLFSEQAKLFLMFNPANVDEVVMWVVQAVSEIPEASIKLAVSDCVVASVSFS